MFLRVPKFDWLQKFTESSETYNRIKALVTMEAVGKGKSVLKTEQQRTKFNSVNKRFHKGQMFFCARPKLFARD